MKYHGIKPVYNVWLSKDDGKYFGPGVAMLIEGVKRTGSLSSAAKEIGMAYSKAWRIIKRSEELTAASCFYPAQAAHTAAVPASHRTPSRYFRTLPPSAKRWILR